MQNPPRANDPGITVIQRELFDDRKSKRQRYAELVIGRPGFWPLLCYELIVTGCSWIPGALGLLLRSWLYPFILGHAGRGVTFGVGVVLRHPWKIRLGDNVIIDDYCCLDAKGTSNRGIDIGSRAFISRNTVLTCKNGDIVIEEDANIGVNVELSSASRIRIGKKVLVAAYTYLVGGDHLYDRTDIPVLDQGRTARGIDIDDHAWIGAHVVVTDGAHVGRDAIVGAGAIVVGDIPEFAVATGIPAKVVRDRRAPST
ncbi:MAG: DapH/DapD/GlmU-related protein [Vicinamibacterales bacterium]